jgi:hypothetical protein
VIRRLIVKLGDRLIERAQRRAPDFVIGGHADPYLRRWWLLPRNRFFNVYLHQFMRSDDDRALHDHPWSNLSILLRGAYTEQTIAAGGIEHRRLLRAGAVRLRMSGRFAHRLELLHDLDGMANVDGSPLTCWTLFITGPRYREWGFHCRGGWVHWKRFTATDDIGAIGRGCDQ